MATCYPNKAGQYSVQFTLGSTRATVYIGRVSLREAEEFTIRLELLADCKARQRPADAATQRWLADLAPRHAARLVTLGLIGEQGVGTIAELCQYCTDHADVEPNSLIKYHDATHSLTTHFGAERPIYAITPTQAEGFRHWLLAHGRRKGNGPLSETTVKKRLEQVKQFFATAVEKGWITSSPFGRLTVIVGDVSERLHYVERDHALAIMAAARPDMRLLIALARFGGLRTPSEAWPLRWEYVDWDKQTMRVFSPKQRRRESKRWRTIPLFPEFRGLLGQCRQDEGPIFQRPDITDAALRNRVEALCLKCGIMPWPKIWQNMRSTRETELLDQNYPVHVVCQWIGNSVAVALKHYTQIAKEHVSRAVAGVDCNEMQAITEFSPKVTSNLLVPPSAKGCSRDTEGQRKPR